MQFGSRGWQHRAWAGSFYPDDLPSEWRLPFYNNEFNTVLIPSDELLNTEQDQMQEWVDDCSEDFSFFVEFDSQQEFSRQFQMAQVLLPQLAGIVLDNSVEELNLSENNILVLASNVLGKQIQIYAPNTAAAKKHIVSDYAQLVYNIATESSSSQRKCLGLLRSNSITTIALTNLLNTLNKIDGGCEALFFAAPKPEIELLRQATTLYEISF